MKHYKNIFIVAAIAVLSFLCHSAYGWSDSSVVDSIKAVSDLSQSDLDRWKLLWLGGLADTGALGASVYGMYKSYQFSKGLTPSEFNLDKIKNVLGDQMYGMIFRGYQPSERLQSWVTSKGVWAGAGALGAGLAAYKVLYPRVQSGILNKIRKYVALCRQLAVTKQFYHNENEFKQALQQKGNTVWLVSNPVAVDKGFKDLINQGAVALLLLEQLLPNDDIVQPSQTVTQYAQPVSLYDQGKEIGLMEPREFGLRVSRMDPTELRNVVYFFKENAEHNFRFIQKALVAENRRRELEQSARGRELDVQGKEARLVGQHVKNVTSQWQLLKDITSSVGTVVTAIFPKELKDVLKEYGPSTALMIGAWKGYQWLQPAQTQEQ